jgi:hypothetical protein
MIFLKNFSCAFFLYLPFVAVFARHIAYTLETDGVAHIKLDAINRLSPTVLARFMLFLHLPSYLS